MGNVKTFNLTLKALLDKDSRSNESIAAAAGVTPATISKISSGANASPEVMGQIARAFPQQSTRLALLATWLADRAAEAHFTEAHIRAAFGTETGLNIPPQIRDHLANLLREAEHNPDLLDLIESLSNTFTTSRSGTTETASVPYSEVAEGPGPAKMPPPKPVRYKAPKKTK